MNKFSYKNLSSFKWFVLQNFPFIEADFDAITNWQLFCKLGEEMNKIIEKVNQAGEQTENLTNAFIELQNYVNDYFENLDVQEEINNKLDEMSESGELAEIINQEIFTELNAAIQNNTNNINSIKNEMKTYPFYDMLKNGGYADGTSANDTIFNNAKNNGYRKFYFSQNENNNAIYFFTDKPNFNDCEIYTDNNVIISIPNSNFFSNSKNGIYNSNIKLLDRNFNKSYLLPKNNFNFYNKINTSIDYSIKNLKNNNGLENYKYLSFNVNSRLFEEKTLTNFFTLQDYQLKHTATENFYIVCVPLRGIGQVIETVIEPSQGNQAKPCFGCVMENLENGFYVTPYSGIKATVWYAYGTNYDTYTDELNMLKHNAMPYYDWSKPYRLKLKVLDENKIVAFYNDVPYCIIPYDSDKKYLGFGIFQPHIGDSMLQFSDYFQENTPLNFNTKILLLGDSRLEGGDTSLQIKELLKNNLLLNGGLQNVEIINESVGGYTSTNVLAKLQTLDLSEYDFVVTNVGINNSGNIADNCTNSFNLIEYIISQNCIPIILLPAVTGQISPMSITMQEKYNNIYSPNLLGYIIRMASGNYRYKLFSIVPNCYGNATSQNPFENISNDGVHPNNLGIIQYCFNIANAILGLLKS